jgi:hypothetical protein
MCGVAPGTPDDDNSRTDGRAAPSPVMGGWKKTRFNVFPWCREKSREMEKFLDSLGPRPACAKPALRFGEGRA